jgi:uncharacterized protein
VLEVTFSRDRRGQFRAFSASGHTDFAEHGEDIVCAAVSAILQAARLGLERYATAPTATQRPGEMELGWSAADAELESVRAIVTTAEMAIEEIARRYPEHVRLTISPRG